jgi:RND family efflux transporter MFP subunit
MNPRLPPSHQRRSRRLRVFGILLLLGAAAIAAQGIRQRFANERALVKATNEAAIPTVALAHVEPDTKPIELVLPGDIEAWYLAPIYARVNGYLKMWYTDIGARVKAGDLLAEIDAPDLDQQYQQAKSDLLKAQADEKLADITAQRWKRLVATTAVSQQATDVNVQDQAAKHAATKAAEAKVGYLAALESFKRLIAPFDGVVTARRTDVGDLISVGSGSTKRVLFEVADIHEMRVYVRVPQPYVAQTKVGLKAELHLPQYPGRAFPAVLATTAESINPTSRTLLVELHAPNPTGELQPGTYAEVHFLLPPVPNSYRVPVSALLFQKHGLQVAVLDPTNHVILKNVQVGLDMGATVQIIAGLNPNDRVIDSPPDSISNGDFVHVQNHQGEKFPVAQSNHQQFSEANK